MNDLRRYSRSKDVLTKLGEELRSFLDTLLTFGLCRPSGQSGLFSFQTRSLGLGSQLTDFFFIKSL